MASQKSQGGVADLRKVRQVRQYTDESVTGEELQQLLDVARWSGSSRNTQPWQFIVVTDKDQLRELGDIRTPINWVGTAPLAIAIVLDGKSETSEAYDEGRVTERLLIEAGNLELGGGTAWFGDADQQQRGKDILGVGADHTARSLVVIGHPVTSKDPRPNPAAAGRRPLSELVSYGKLGQRQPRG